MKKYLLKSFALLAMLFSALTMSAATQYCDVLLETQDGDVKYSLYHVSGNTYGIQIVPQDGMTLTDIFNPNIGVNQSAGAGITIVKDLWSISNNVATAIFQTASETSEPTNFFTASISFIKSGGKTAGDLVTVVIPASDIDWTTTCDASDEGGGDTSTPVLESVELFGAAQNFVLLTPTATDDKGVTAYLIAKNGGAETEVTPDATTGQIKIASLTLGTTYTYTVKAKDADGNVSNAKEITFSTLDNVFCEEEVLPGTAQEFANQKLTFTAKKVSDTETYFAISSSTSTLTKISTVTFYSNAGETGTYGGGVLPDGYVLKDGWTLTDNTLSKTVTWTTYPTAPFRASINATRSKNSDTEKAMINWMYTMDLSNTCGEDPEPTPDPEEPEVTDKWADVNWVADSDNKYKVLHECLTQVVSVQQPGWAEERGIYVSVPEGISSCTVNGAIDGAGMILYLSSFTAKETEVTINYAGGSCTFWVYYADGTEGGGETPSTPTEVYDVNFALASNGSSAEATTGDAAQAIDNNPGSRWESASADPQTWTLDLGQARIFNTLEIVWEGAYGKTFTVSASDDKETWTPIWTVEGQELAGFPYTQTQKIDKTTARYIQFHGTERGTGYGYSFYEFRVYLAGTSTLTSLEATLANGLAKVGEGLAINVTAKDQNGKTMANAGEVTYTITPVDAGTITNNVYTPARIGLASIVATIGEVSAPAFEVFAYDGENLALNKSATAGYLNDQAYQSNDNDMGSRWGSDGATHPDNDWWCVDLGNNYDISAVAIMWENARPANYVLEASETAADDSWLPIKTITGVLPTTSPNYEVYVDLTAHPCRYMRVRTTSIEGGYADLAYGISIFDVQVFGTESASPTKAVSASVNDAAMGTATVTQNGVDVTEVETGSEVTFTAIANEGYAFVNWSNGNTNPSFTTTVDAAMHLTANFRALGTVYCNTPMTVDGHTIYVTMKRSAPGTYQLIVRSEENLTNFGGTNFYRSNNIHVIDLRDQGVLSEDKHILTATFSAETAPYMGTPLYVVFEGIGERTYPQLTNIEYDVECSEDVTVTGLALNPASISLMVGGSQTLKPVFTPAHAFTNELEWSSSKESVATVDENGVITAVALGDAVITAKLISNPAITATCNVTVTNFTAHTFYGYGSPNGVDFAYSLTNNANGTVTIVADVLTNNPGLGTISFSIDDEWKDMTKNADGTYTRTSEKTFSMGQEVHCFLHAPYTGGVGRLDFDYIIGSSNERPNIAITSVTLDKTSGAMLIGETLQLTAIFNPGTATNKTVSWSSDNTTVAEVNANGLVTAKAEGTATITVTTADGGKTAQCVVTVSTPQVRTWWGTGEVTINGHDVDIIYSITHNLDKTLTYTVIFGDDTDMIRQVNVRSVADVYHNLTGFDSANKTASYTSTTTHSSGEVITGLFYFGVDGVDFTYTVGSSNERPNPSVEGVALNHTTYDLLVNETLQLNATIYPGYAENKAITWSSNNSAIAEVDANGLVTAKAVGTATITVTTADGNKTATCTVTVIAALTESTYYASTYVKKDADAYLGINYSITRTANRTLRYVVKVNNSEDVDLEFNVVVNENWQRMTYDASANTYTYTTVTKYADGDVVSGFFRQIKYGTEGRWDFNYVVGSTSTTPRTMVAVNDEDADLTHLNDGSVYDVILKRNFVMDNDWNTISLPFALTEEQVKEVFGEGTRITKLLSSELKSSTEIDIQFEDVTSIEAATPYLILPEKNVDLGTLIENITINVTPNILEAGITKMIPVLKTENFTGQDNTFFLGANDNLYNRSADGKIKGMRAYFQFSTLTPEQLRNVRARVVFNENTETNVDNITTDEAAVKVIQNGQLIIIRNGVKYNVQGQKL